MSKSGFPRPHTHTRLDCGRSCWSGDGAVMQRQRHIAHAAAARLVSPPPVGCEQLMLCAIAAAAESTVSSLIPSSRSPPSPPSLSLPAIPTQTRLLMIGVQLLTPGASHKHRISSFAYFSRLLSDGRTPHHHAAHEQHTHTAAFCFPVSPVFFDHHYVSCRTSHPSALFLHSSDQDQAEQLADEDQRHEQDDEDDVNKDLTRSGQRDVTGRPRACCYSCHSHDDHHQ